MPSPLPWLCTRLPSFNLSKQMLRDLIQGLQGQNLYSLYPTPLVSLLD